MYVRLSISISAFSVEIYTSKETGRGALARTVKVRSACSNRGELAFRRSAR